MSIHSYTVCNYCYFSCPVNRKYGLFGRHPFFRKKANTVF